jgi:hypothetical protein
MPYGMRVCVCGWVCVGACWFLAAALVSAMHTLPRRHTPFRWSPMVTQDTSSRSDHSLLHNMGCRGVGRGRGDCEQWVWPRHTDLVLLGGWGFGVGLGVGGRKTLMDKGG